MAQKPPIHGRDHRPGGADPIPGTGIQFDTYPQAGNWLYAETTGGTGSPHGYGIELVATDDISMETDGTFFMDGDHADWRFRGSAPAFKLRTDSPMQFQNLLDGSTITFECYQFIVDATGFGDGNNVRMVADRMLLDTTGGGNGDIQITAETAMTLTSNTTGVALIANAGAILLQAGGTITFDGSQRASVVTLDDVILLLQAYGLAA